jgi:hypothetical protein
MLKQLGIASALAVALLVGANAAYSPCTDCYEAARQKVAACQRNLPAPRKNPTKEEQAARTKAESACNQIAIEANKECKGVCGLK